MSTVQLDLEGAGGGTVVVDGADLSNAVSHVEVKASARGTTQVRLDVNLPALVKLRGVEVAGLSTALVLADVNDERLRQIVKWGDDSTKDHPDGTGPTIPSLNAREAAQHATDYAAEHGTLTWRHILEEEVYEALAESDPDALEAELVQVAAVAVKWVEALRRRRAAR